MRKLLLSAGMLTMACACIGAQNFIQRELVVYNPEAGIKLGATLTLPVDSAPRAALVLATGSGAQNRDEEILGHKPFKTIAEYLSKNGYAVLRMDDRGVGDSQGDPAQTTTDDYVSDLSAAIAKLDSCFSTSLPKGVLGHSEGGSAAIKIANKNPRCRFIITLAAPAWTGDSIIMSQARAMATALTGRWDGESKQRRILDIVMSDLPPLMLQSALYMEIASAYGELAKMPEVQRQIQQQVAVMATPSYRAIVKFNPTADIQSVDKPWLAMNGDKDTQVLPGNLATISDLNPNVTILLLPSHNHLFQRCSTGSVQEYATLTEDISPQTLSAVLQFLDSLL